MEKKYTEITAAKDGNLIPFVERTALHSKYNIGRESETFAAQFSGEGFFIVLGLAGGYHITALLKRFPNSKVIAVENSSDDIKFLESIPEIKNLKKDERIRIASKDNIKSTLLSFYKPAIHGNITIAALRAWENIFQETKSEVIGKINETLKIISADFSVQSHFGKIWQKNIFQNLKIASELNQNTTSIMEGIPTEKTAAIIAAGPTFDRSFEEIAKNRKKYYVIATDTAFSALEKRNIKVDAVVSVDGQNVSHAHYMHKIRSDTIFVFDLCANSSAVKKVAIASKKIIFAETGHPLSKYASTYRGKDSFITIETGSGTVTIAAASFAIKAGFKKLEVFGADFSYNNGKPYTKGTYLDSIYRRDESRIDNSETRFSALMFRTELKKIGERKFNTEILESYEKSLENFMISNGFIEKKSTDEVRIFANSENRRMNYDFEKFDYEDFKRFYGIKLEVGIPHENTAEMMTLLPLAANLKSEILAYTKTLGYTKIL